jgi:two-component system, OmpR family, clock-associated histidine kinase SasA
VRLFNMQASFFAKPTMTDAPLQILLFVDQRPNSKEQIRQIRSFFKNLNSAYPFELQIVDVGEQPQLAEYFRLVATPSLIKIHPAPRQTLTGGDLVEKLASWWSRWERSVEDYLVDSESPASATPAGIPSIALSSEVLKLSDEIFRLKQERDSLTSQLNFKDQIIAMLAHDLRNPLTAASIAIETLEIGLQPKDNQPSKLAPKMIGQLLHHARSQIRTIDRMITDILQAARGSSGELHVLPEPLDLGILCRDVLDGLRDRFKSKQQKLEIDIPTDLPYVYADPDRVRQVFVNILDNAIKYTPNEGTIHVSILHRTTQKVQVSICDNGLGIPEENRANIFEDHFRLQRDAAKDGYGIGLSLCQRIIRAHYGQIWVDSIPHQGSCFHFTLPVHRSDDRLSRLI